MSMALQRALVVLLVVNIGLTSAVLLRQERAVTTAASEEARLLPEGEVVPFAEKVVMAFNAADASALYGLYHEDARARLTQQEVADQLDRLRDLFGQVRQMSYLNNLRLGEQGSEEYFQAHFSVGVARPDRKNAQLVLHLIREDGEIFLYGMRINAAQP